MFGKFYSFSSKIASKRFVLKKHLVTHVSFFDATDNTINLVVHTDNREQQIAFNLDEAKELLKQLTSSIEEVESRKKVEQLNNNERN